MIIPISIIDDVRSVTTIRYGSKIKFGYYSVAKQVYKELVKYNKDKYKVIKQKGSTFLLMNKVKIKSDGKCEELIKIIRKNERWENESIKYININNYSKTMVIDYYNRVVRVKLEDEVEYKLTPVLFHKLKKERIIGWVTIERKFS